MYAGLDPVTGRKKHRYATASNKRAASRLERDMLAEVARTSTDADLNHLLDRWLKVARHAPSTAHTAGTRLAKWVRPTLGDSPIREISTETLDQFYLDLEDELAPATVVRVHGLLRAAFAQAVRWGWLDKNPAVGVRLPEVPNPQPVALGADDVRRLLREVPADFAAFLRLVAVTGLRRGEACALRRSDIDLDGGAIRKVRALSMGHERGTKTGARYALAVDPGTIAALRAHLAAMDDRAAACRVRVPKDGFVFSNEINCLAPWRPDSVGQRLGRQCRKLGLPNIRLKDLRDWMVTSALEHGHSVRTAAARAGHSRATTTLTHYAAWVPASDAALADELGDLLDG